MQDSNNLDELVQQDQEINATPDPNAPRIVQTDTGAKDGQNKCPKCGATEITLNPNNGLLRCGFCRHEFAPEVAIGVGDCIESLEGKVIGSGATEIIADTNDILTFKCSSCAAEVIIDTKEATQARCHWCRNTLSVNQQIPNGAVPDMLLPFSVKQSDAQAEIEKFVSKRKFFANPKFKAEFCIENVMGVYLPYMVVDINARAKLTGQGEKLIRSYVRGSKNNRTTYYDADLYNVDREFDILVDDLTIESSADKLKRESNNTNNVINAIMPFDTDQCVKWNANYLRGYTSQKRDTNIDDLKGLVENKTKDIARHSANETLIEYNRGVRWDNEELNIKGQRWKAAYLPVWLYSYQQVFNENKKLLHYVAVNARNKKTMGSVPINKPKLFGVSAIVQIIGSILGFIVLFAALAAEDGGQLFVLALLLFSSGFVYFGIIVAKYRNAKARHKHEADTKTEIKNLHKIDNFVKHQKRLQNSVMHGANNFNVSNGSSKSGIGNLIGTTGIASTIKEQINKEGGN